MKETLLIDLPQLCIQEILLFLSSQDIGSLSSTCTEIRDLMIGFKITEASYIHRKIGNSGHYKSPVVSVTTFLLYLLESQMKWRPVTIIIKDHKWKEGYVLLTRYLESKQSASTTQLILEHCKLGEVFASYLGMALTKNKRLEKLNLAFNDFNDTAIQYMMEGISTHSSLISLNLSNNQFGDKGVATIGKMLENNNFIQELYLYNDKVREYDVTSSSWLDASLHLFSSLSICGHASKLKLLDIQDQFIGDYGCEKLGNVFTSKYGVKSLESLNLAGCEIGPVGIEKLSAGIKAMDRITLLNLSSNSIDKLGFMYLVKAFESSSMNLKYLTLENIEPDLHSCESGQLLHQLISRFQNCLEFLSLSFNDLTDVMTSAASAFKSCAKLKHLKLQGCDLSDINAVAIMTNLKNTKSLIQLFLGYNDNMGIVGFKALADLIAVNDSIKLVEVANCNTNSDNIDDDYLINKIKCNKSLLYFIGTYSICDDAQESIDLLLQDRL